MLDGAWMWESDPGSGTPEAPEHVCEKVQRERLFFSTIEFCRAYGNHWKDMKQQYHLVWDDANYTTSQELQTGFLNFDWIRRQAVRHIRAVDYCLCKRSHIHGKLRTMLPEDAVMEAEVDGEEPNEKIHRPILNSHCFGDDEDDDGDEDDVDHSQMDSVPFDLDYDDYGSAPIKNGRAPRREPGVWTVNRDGVWILDECWSRWKDMGYRLHPTFFSTINPKVPVHDTLLPCPTPRTTPYCHSQTWQEPTVLHLSGQEMLDEAGPRRDSTESQRVLVKGVEREPGATDNATKLIGLDLEKDAISLPEEDIDISTDLDSIIWVTPALDFRMNFLLLHLTPSNLGSAAFATNNFVYVNLVHPPTDLEELETPKNRTRSNVPLSRIPHIELGHVGEAAKRINLYAFFPRMIGKHTKSNRYSTLLPSPLQSLWFDTVIQACQKTFNTAGFSEYIPTGLDEVRNRAGSNRKETMPLANSAVVQTLIKELVFSIQNDSYLLSQFGSFFTVADGRGMKMATKQCIPEVVQPGESSTVFGLVKEQFNDLDWDQMLDQSKGTLYLDLGISFHSNSNKSLVGLWRLEKLQESFSEMGTKKGCIHHFNTFAFYGGMKAEMKARSKTELHLVSRLSYCLAFELVRRPGTKDYLCPDKDIVDNSERFHHACRSWLSLFEGAVGRSFGVREEIRGIGSTIINLLPFAPLKVNLSTRPISHLMLITIRREITSNQIQFYGLIPLHFSILLHVVFQLSVSFISEHIPNSTQITDCRHLSTATLCDM